LLSILEKDKRCDQFVVKGDQFVVKGTNRI
jgi:hypothetical protein